MHVNTLHKHRNMMKVSQKVQISFLVQYFVLANLKSRIQIGSKPDWIHKQDPWPKECPHGLKMNISPIQVWHMPPLVCVYSQESDIEKYFFFVPGDLWHPPPCLRQIGYQFLASASRQYSATLEAVLTSLLYLNFVAAWISNFGVSIQAIFRVGHRVLFRSERSALSCSKKRTLRSFPFFS